MQGSKLKKIVYILILTEENVLKLFGKKQKLIFFDQNNKLQDIFGNEPFLNEVHHSKKLPVNSAS